MNTAQLIALAEREPEDVARGLVALVKAAEAEAFAAREEMSKWMNAVSTIAQCCDVPGLLVCAAKGDTRSVSYIACQLGNDARPSQKARAERRTMAEVKPLNGAKTHPLTKHAESRLKEIEACPVPRLRLNPGVANRLLRGGLIEPVLLPSPFAIHSGVPIEHAQITEAGRAHLVTLEKREDRA